MKSIQPAENIRSFRRHDHLARSGDVQDTIYQLQEGWACRYRVLPEGRRQITALFLPGDYCEAHWMLAGRADLPVMALTEVRVSEIPLATVHAKPGQGVMQLLGEVMRTFNRQTDWIVGLGRKTAIERVEALMEEIYDRMAQVGRVANGSCTVPLTQHDIADIVGLTPVHVNRVMGDLRERGSLRFTGKILHLRRRDRGDGAANGSAVPNQISCSLNGGTAHAAGQAKPLY
ncbi:Crp/Fnr family transcriptional regulator [Novosphingobium resinovorum]|uniref:Crp/Fnr family transcriptional regulator n=1 Tax=Novosphingobium TaxID=165696 RepID=UPI001B3C5AFA|nr:MULTISPECIES: Crp/Fnr family transcriptional regulator [Novosphingobium]MBF7013835.1 Crp/Fnr family transcriptional regulator [Novosphingobium sp. HR1a]WJM25979.1 Crp/Fnr family transcriptional regulator [Novosphingobium resinovorum]